MSKENNIDFVLNLLMRIILDNSLPSGAFGHYNKIKLFVMTWFLLLRKSSRAKLLLGKRLIFGTHGIRRYTL